MSYGHALKTAGRQRGSIAAYRRAIELEPRLGEAYWSLANLKTFRFAARTSTAMREQLARDGPVGRRPAVTSISRSARRWRTRGTMQSRFEHYAEGNRLRRAVIRYDADGRSPTACGASKTLFTPRILRRTRRAGAAGARPDLHRRPAALGLDAASSRSWPATRRWRARWSCPTSARSCRPRWARREAVASRPATRRSLAELDAAQLRELGEQYLEQHPHPAQDRRALLHRQDAEQLGARRR